MEFVPFTTEQLSYLTKQDPCLAPIFAGVFASDQLPGLPELWKKELTSSTPTLSINPDHIGWLFSPKNTLAKSWIVTDYHCIGTNHLMCTNGYAKTFTSSEVTP